MIGQKYDDPDNAKAKIRSGSHELLFEHIDWLYFNFEEFAYGEISVAMGNSKYPLSIEVIEAEKKSKGASVFAGNYSKFGDKTFNMKPYYKKENFFLFYSEKQWNIGENLGMMLDKNILLTLDV